MKSAYAALRSIDRKTLLLFFVSLICYSGTSLTAQYNYGEVLQKSMFFYQCQRSGDLPANFPVNWRDDSGLSDGSDNSLDLTGGWYDAGDHVKFGFPMAASATLLAWGGIEEEATYKSLGLWDDLLDNLRYVNDYFIKCHVRNSNGTTSRFYGQVGNGSADHAFWGSPEIMQMARPSYFVDQANPGSDLTGETAAAMAAASILFANDDPAYSAQLLDHAKALYQFADNYRGKYSTSISDASGFYNSWSGYNDEIVWGAIWLYKATNMASYLTKAETEYANLGNEQGGTVKAYRWTIAWDDKSYGAYALLAELTGNSQYEADAERWLDYWTTGYNGQRINYSPGGQAHLDTWGSLRYAANTAFVAQQYSDHIATSKPAKAATYRNFAKDQLNYMLGDNPRNSSYVVGFGTNPPVNPHHRAAHGTWTNSLQTPVTSRHILYGALVGGPGTANDSYVDDRGDYIANEVACDYNSGFTSAIVRMAADYGGSTLPNFPQPETIPYGSEYFNDAKVNASGNTFTEIAVWANNHSAWPAKMTDNVCYRYFIDISEGLAAGYSASEYTINLNTSPGGTNASALTQWAGTVYYVEVCFNGVQIYPGGQQFAKKEAQLRIGMPNNAPASAWDPTNDWSYNVSSTQAMNNSLQLNPRIPFYNDGELLFGELPGGGNNPVAAISANPTTGFGPLTVSFDGSGSTDPNSDPLTYAWDFGDGTSGTGASASHVYTTFGTFTATLTVDDGNGNTDTESVTINVNDPNVAPEASFVATPTSGVAPLVVSFDASASSDANNDPLTYTWDFGDGTSGTGVTTNHTYTTVGSYTAELTVSDGSNSSVITTQIVVSDGTPIAAFTATPMTGNAPLLVEFDASGSSDPNGGSLTYSWNFGDGTSGSGVMANHTYANPGSFVVTLTVNDGVDGPASVSKTIQVIDPSASNDLRVEYRVGWSTNPTNNTITSHFKLINDGSTAVPYDQLTIRYWFTNDNPSELNYWCDWAALGTSFVNGEFVTLSSPVGGADTYLEVSFAAGAGNLPANDDSGEIQSRMAKSNWTPFNQADDYSFDPTITNFTAFDHITLYQNGNLVYGVEPGTAQRTASENSDLRILMDANPFTSKADFRILSTSDEGETVVEVVNQLGQLVYSSLENITKNTPQGVSINTEDWSNGLYFIKISTTSQSNTIAVIKQ